MDYIALAAPVIEALVLPVLMALAGYVVTLLPGPARDFLGSAVHQRDIELLMSAMVRRALAAKAQGVPTTQPTVATPQAQVAAVAASDLEIYVKQSMPDLLNKLQPTASSLRTMALSALAKAAAETKQLG